MSISVDNSGRVYVDFNRLLFPYTHREGSVLTNELPEECDQFRFLRPTCLDNLKGSVELILEKTSDMRISIPFDLSSHPFIIIPLPWFIRSRRPIAFVDLDGKTGLASGQVPGFQDWKYPGTLTQTWHQVQMTQIYSNPLNFFVSPCPGYPCC